MLLNLQLDAYLDAWRQATGGVLRTSSYISYVGPDGPIRNAANAAFLARLYQASYPGADTALDCWAEYEARSLSGDGQLAYLVGARQHAPLRPQHRVSLAY